MPSGQFEQIEPIKSLKEFFKNSVSQAMRRQGLSANDHTEHYVVNLLTIFARSESLFDLTAEGTELTPVAKVLADAVGAERVEERNHALQRVGDVSLFIAGFFGDGLKTRLVDVDYYVFMGGTAYGTLSENVRGSRRGKVYSRVFAELAEKFQEFVDVLAAIREKESPSQSDILRLYETWIRTGSERAAKMLRAHGIEPNRATGVDTRH
jgi:hypothetical protein